MFKKNNNLNFENMQTITERKHNNINIVSKCKFIIIIITIIINIIIMLVSLSVIIFDVKCH